MSTRAQSTAATRERLLSAAWRQFSTAPYESVRLQEVASEAGVSAQTLHSHFGSKDGLFAAAYAWWGQDVIASRDQAKPGALAEAIAILFDVYEEYGDQVLRMIAQEERVPAIRQLTDAGRAYHQLWCRRTFEPLLRGLPSRHRRRRLIGIATATDLLVWKLLRRDTKVERREAERIVLEMVLDFRCEAR
jgi:AcrR family transcriptional regulator